MMEKNIPMNVSAQTQTTDTPNAIQQEAQKLVEQAKHAGILRKMFPDEQQRELAKAQLAVVKTEYEFRNKALIIAKNGMIQHMRDQVDAMVSVEGIKIHAWKEREIRNSVTIREKEVNDFIDTFAQSYAESVKRVESYPKGKLKELEIERIDRVLVDTYAHMAHIKDKFDSALRFES